MAPLRHRRSYKKELYYILCITVVVVILLFSFLGPGGYRDLLRARRDLEQQARRVEELKRENYSRMKAIEGLRSDRGALEKYAREKGYGREGEIVQPVPGQSEAKQ